LFFADHFVIFSTFAPSQVFLQVNLKMQLTIQGEKGGSAQIQFPGGSVGDLEAVVSELVGADVSGTLKLGDQLLMPKYPPASAFGVADGSTITVPGVQVSNRPKGLVTMNDYTQKLTIDVPLDAVKSILAFGQFELMMPYVGMPPSAIGLEFSDGNNVGSVRTFTSKGTGKKMFAEKLETLSEDGSKFSYSVKVLPLRSAPFSLYDICAGPQMTAKSDTQTEITWTGVYKVLPQYHAAATAIITRLHGGFTSAAAAMYKKQQQAKL